MSKPAAAPAAQLPVVRNAQLPARLADLEEIIEAGFETFYEVGRALAHIRDAELYRGSYLTFASYLRERWGFTPQRARSLIDSAEIIDSMTLDSVVPSGPGVVHELAPLPRSLRADVWRDALESTKRTTNGQPNPTAEEVRQLVTRKLDRASGRSSTHVPTGESLLASESEVLERVRRGATIVANQRSQQRLIAAATAEGLAMRIDRGSRWGNPFVVDEDGSREEVVAAYRHHYLPNKPSLQRRVDELRGKLLLCWCAPDLCHGDVLAEMAGMGTPGDDRHRRAIHLSAVPWRNGSPGSGISAPRWAGLPP